MFLADIFTEIEKALSNAEKEIMSSIDTPSNKAIVQAAINGAVKGAIQSAPSGNGSAIGAGAAAGAIAGATQEIENQKQTTS